QAVAVRQGAVLVSFPPLPRAVDDLARVGRDGEIAWLLRSLLAGAGGRAGKRQRAGGARAPPKESVQLRRWEVSGARSRWTVPRAACSRRARRRFSRPGPTRTPRGSSRA